MTKTNRAILTHFSVLLFVAVLILTLARFFPIAERIADLQRSLAKMPAVAPLLHSLLLALCNVLLLPGGIVSIPGRIKTWWARRAAESAETATPVAS